MIIITGAAGFIGSAMAAHLIDRGRDDLWLVDDFSRSDREKNYVDKAVRGLIERDHLFDWLEAYPQKPKIIIHLGARTDTTEFDEEIFNRLNLSYSQQVWAYCTAHRVPLIYASSAATYGEGELGFDDDPSLISSLRPLNPYGQSKQDFDQWVLSQPTAPPHWYGLKFFNVYGPNEYHKGRMASVIFHAFHQINRTGGMKLFRSHRPEWKDGEQKRDFIYVKDLANVMRFLMAKRPTNGIYNLGTGQARTFRELTEATFTAMNREPNISFIDIPEDIRDKYQYFTEARMDRLRAIGYTTDFTSLEDGVRDYVQNYLIPNNIW